MENNGTWLSPGYGTWANHLLNMFQNDIQYHVNDVKSDNVRRRPSTVCNWKNPRGCRFRSDESSKVAWYKNNFLLANPEKFQSLSINPRNIDAANGDRALYIDNQEIKKTEQIKLLGVYIDENLNFAGHISDLCTRTSQKVGVLVCLRNLIQG